MDDVQNDLVKTQKDVTQQGVVNDQYNTEGNVCYLALNLCLI